VLDAASKAAELVDASAQAKHGIMVCEYSDMNHRLVEFSPDGKLVWEHKFPAVAVCFRMSGADDVLFADGGSPTGVQLIDRNHKVLFDYRAKCEQILTCDVLPSGNLLLAEQGPCQAVEVNRSGEVVSTLKMNTTEQTAHRQVRCIHRLDNGHILACHEAEAVVREYDRDGKSVWEYPNVTNVFEALRLPDGNTLIGCGTDKRVIEVTPDKKIVWEFTAAEAPDLNLTWITSLQVLKNGNFVIANFLRGQEGRGVHAFEVTHDSRKQVVWKFADHGLVKSITMVRVLDDE
jgi:outer membrane protein assembly factor BamB